MIVMFVSNILTCVLKLCEFDIYSFLEMKRQGQVKGRYQNDAKQDLSETNLLSSDLQTRKTNFKRRICRINTENQASTSEDQFKMHLNIDSRNVYPTSPKRMFNRIRPLKQPNKNTGKSVEQIQDKDSERSFNLSLERKRKLRLNPTDQQERSSNLKCSVDPAKMPKLTNYERKIRKAIQIRFRQSTDREYCYRSEQECPNQSLRSMKEGQFVKQKGDQSQFDGHYSELLNHQFISINKFHEIKRLNEEKTGLAQSQSSNLYFRRVTKKRNNLMVSKEEPYIYKKEPFRSSNKHSQGRSSRNTSNFSTIKQFEQATRTFLKQQQRPSQPNKVKNTTDDYLESPFYIHRQQQVINPQYSAPKKNTFNKTTFNNLRPSHESHSNRERQTRNDKRNRPSRAISSRLSSGDERIIKELMKGNRNQYIKAENQGSGTQLNRQQQKREEGARHSRWRVDEINIKLKPEKVLGFEFDDKKQEVHAHRTNNTEGGRQLQARDVKQGNSKSKPRRQLKIKTEQSEIISTNAIEKKDYPSAISSNRIFRRNSDFEDEYSAVAEQNENGTMGAEKNISSLSATNKRRKSDLLKLLKMANERNTMLESGGNVHQKRVALLSYRQRIAEQSATTVPDQSRDRRSRFTTIE